MFSSCCRQRNQLRNILLRKILRLYLLFSIIQKKVKDIRKNLRVSYVFFNDCCILSYCVYIVFLIPKFSISIGKFPIPLFPEDLQTASYPKNTYQSAAAASSGRAVFTSLNMILFRISSAISVLYASASVGISREESTRTNPSETSSSVD